MKEFFDGLSDDERDLVFRIVRTYLNNANYEATEIRTEMMDPDEWELYKKVESFMRGKQDTYARRPLPR